MSAVTDFFSVADKGLDGFLAFQANALQNDRIEAEIAALNRQSISLPSIAPEPAILTQLQPLPAMTVPTSAAPVSNIRLLDDSVLQGLLNNDQAIAAQLVSLDQKSVAATDKLRADELGGGMTTEMMIAIGVALLIIAAGAR